ncbi:class I SAM-dependent methyltransferase [Xenorhabdus miraniensis]|uniref:DUF4942 domain-containing protein n=1 Tax=Xenorhabdus miraniensis TaxID=351674 RepID=A0A2D0JMN9_9GAMM|nr:class I SAM-dependent methyltransferase [Xenorhabdus miraniensis]PHM47573.1 hypothetical protein Xmir_03128 [Xenorhabdus miraniensis]
MNNFFSDKRINYLSEEDGTAFKRAVAHSFSRFDRRFRAHDGWVFGDSIYIQNIFEVRNEEKITSDIRQLLEDIEMIFSLLDGKNISDKSRFSIIDALISTENNEQTDVKIHIDSEYLSGYVNEKKECYFWFKREDLVKEVIRILSDYYGELNLEGTNLDESRGLYEPVLDLATNYGFFPTPIEVAHRIVAEAEIVHTPAPHRLTVLEPSAGLGNLAKFAVYAGGIVDCIEVHTERCTELDNTHLFRHVINADFILVEPDQKELYDRIIMNPPFEGERDIDHVIHALKFLKSDGLLVSIMSPGTEFRNRRKSKEFRNLMNSLNARWIDLPDDSFASVGSHSNTIILKVWKDGR